jgi:cation diffusion facilitator family transporter
LNVERWGWYSVGVNVALAGINLVVSLASGSLAVRAELVHNLVDLITAVAVLVGLKLATRKSSAFPYGLYKLENLITVILALMVFVTAYEVAREALQATPSAGQVNVWMVLGLGLALAIPLVFSRYELRAGREVNSPALIADAREYRVHVFTTGAALAALVSQWVGLRLDRAAALIIVIAILKTGWDLLLDGMRVLLDASLEPERLDTVRRILASDPRVAAVQWATGRNAGRFRFVEAGVTLRVSDLEKAGDTAARLEEAVRAAVPHIERALVHIEPLERAELRYAVPLADPGGQISEHFGEAPYFGLTVMRLADGAHLEEQVLRNPHGEVEKAKGIQVAEWLIGHKVDMVLVKESLHGKGPEYAFADAGVEIRMTSATTWAEALNAQEQPMGRVAQLAGSPPTAPGDGGQPTASRAS